VTFEDDQVVLLRGHYGYQIMLELSQDEQIENVAIGDSLAWQVTPNRRADALFLKPLEPDADTNMVVVTNRRRYAFELTAAPGFGAQDADIFYRVRFEYPQTAAEAAALAAALAPLVATNVAYVAAGSEATMPASVFDDGRNTYFQFPADASLPAIFARDASGVETLVNFTMRGPVVVVQQLAPGFVLRNGAEETMVRNDGWVAPLARPAADGSTEPMMGAPRVEPAPRRGFWGTLLRSGRPRP
jgi:type IV secretion system protein VirB9